MSGDEYRYVERMLYSYSKTVKKCEGLALYIASLREKGDVQGQSYKISGHGGKSDPVARHVEEIMRLEKRLRRMMMRVTALNNLREDLQNGNVITITNARNLLRILEDYYMAEKTVNEFLEATHWVRSTFYVRRRELVMIAGEYLRA